MAKVRARKDNGMLFLDFYYLGTRCREQTALPDSAENRKKVQTLLNRIQKEIAQGSFDYAGTFPGSPRASLGKASPVSAPVVGQPPASVDRHEVPLFAEFSVTWRAEMAPQWRRLHRGSVDAIFDAHLLPAFGDRPLSTITKADVLAARARMAALPGRTGETLSPASINKAIGILRQCTTEARERFGLPDVVIGAGSVVAAGAVLNPGARVGETAIINTASSVDHDALVRLCDLAEPGGRLLHVDHGQRGGCRRAVGGQGAARARVSIHQPLPRRPRLHRRTGAQRAAALAGPRAARQAGDELSWRARAHAPAGRPLPRRMPSHCAPAGPAPGAQGG